MHSHVLKFKRALKGTFPLTCVPSHQYPIPRSKYCYWFFMYFPISMLWQTLLVEP